MRFFLLLFVFVSISYSVTVDIYQSCNFTTDIYDSAINVGDTINDSSYTAPTSWGDNPNCTPYLLPYWTIKYPKYIGPRYNRVFASDSNVIQFPDEIIVDGVDRNTTVSRTMSFFNLDDSTALQVTFGNYPRFRWQEGWNPSYGPFYDSQIVACYYTPHDTDMAGGSNTFDIIIMDVFNSYAVLQLIGEHTIGAVDGLYIRAHSSTLVGGTWHQTIADTCIPVVYNKTYWVNLFYDAPNEECVVAVFDPANNYAQVGNNSVSIGKPFTDGKGSSSRIQFGRADAHGDVATNTPSYDTSFGVFSHILIDFTSPDFPLLPTAGGVSKKHYVSTTGTGTWTESKSINTPCSLALAMSSVAAGDTIYLRGGLYDNDVGTYTITPGATGTAQAGILIENYEDETPIIAHGDEYGISLSGKSYITVRGLTFHKIKYFFYIINRSHYNLIDDCVFDTSLYISSNTYKGSYIADNSTYNKISNCEFYRYGGLLDSGGHASDMLVIGDWGNEVLPLDSTRNNLVENCIFAYGGHSNMTVSGYHNIIRWCEFHNEAWDSSDGDRSCMSYGTNCFRNLYENNIFHHAVAGLSIRSKCNIIRRNQFYNHEQGGIVFATDEEYFTPADSNRVYYNTFMNNGDGGSTAHLKYAIIFSGDFEAWGAAYNIIKGNLSYINNQGKGGDTGSVGFSYGWISPETILGNWNNSINPSFVYTGVANELTPTGTKPDLNLQSSSTACDAAPYLTVITSPTGSGRSFTVSDAGYFCDGFGWGGDTIQIEGRYDKLVVSAVNYTTNTIAVSRSTHWVAGDSVAYSWSGTRHDYGSEERTYRDENSFFRVVDSSYHDSCVIINITSYKSTVYIDTGNGSTWSKIDSTTGSAGTVDTLIGRATKNVRIYARSKQ